MKKFLFALATHTGTIIGVGMFGLPYVAAKSGFVPTVLYFAGIGLIMFLLQVMYAELALQTPARHQFPGFAGLYLGPRFKRYGVVLLTLGTYGALLAYIIIGGQFLYQLLSPVLGGEMIVYQMAYFLVGAGIIYKGVKSIAKTEFFMMVLFFAIIIVLFVVGFPHVKAINLSTWSTRNIFFPYGVVMFALWGLDVVAVLNEYVNRNARQLKAVIFTGLLASVLTYAVFTFTVTGISGASTSTDGLSGLVPYLSNKVLVLGYVFGILTTFTSFISLGEVLKKSFVQDFGLSREVAWFCALFVPLVMFALGMKNFLSVMNITGAITLGIEGVFIAAMYLTLRRDQKFREKLFTLIPRVVVYLVIAVLSCGVFAEVFSSVAGKGG